MIKVKINGQEAFVKRNMTILEACRALGIYVPTLCSHPDLPPIGQCGVDVVKVNGSSLERACVTYCQEGMVIETNTLDVKQASLNNLQKFAPGTMMQKTPDIEDLWNYYQPKKGQPYPPQQNVSIQWDPEKCINCHLCIRACTNVQQIDSIDSITHHIDESCIKCGHCLTVCPTAALTPTSEIGKVLAALSSDKVCIIQTAPSVRVTIAEGFGEPLGTICTGKVVAAARMMGFKYVFDINYGADQTIIEEGTEFMHRLLYNEAPLPQFTSCCPGWVNYVETKHPEVIPHLSTAKSPHMMSGVAIKTYFSHVSGIPAENMFVVSVMPCTAKKDEIVREQHKGVVDAVLTSVEFVELINRYQFDWKTMPTSEYDDLISESTGGATIFGATGGVAEAALRFCYEQMTGMPIGTMIYSDLRGLDGVKTATVNIAGRTIRIAVCNGVGYAHDFLNTGAWKNFDIVEVMACPGGCVGGGGQVIHPRTVPKKDILQARVNALYAIDKQKIQEGKSTTNENSQLLKMYRDYVGSPYSERAKQLFHTWYTDRSMNRSANYYNQFRI